MVTKVTKWGISTDGSARHSHCRGQGFDSPMLHTKPCKSTSARFFHCYFSETIVCKSCMRKNNSANLYEKRQIYRDIKKLAICFSPVIVFQQHVLHRINDCANLYRRRFPVNVDCLVCRETIDCPFQDFIRTVSDNNRRSHHGLNFLLDLIFQDQPFFSALI